MAEYENSNQRWIEQGFKNSPETETVHQYQEMVVKRQAHLDETLPPDALSFRKNVRAMLGFVDGDAVVFFGEQSTGLNEPPLVAGKRLLFAHGQGKYGWRGLEINASSDVIGSEKGFHRAVVPNTRQEEGHSEIQILSLKKHGNNPSFTVPGDSVDTKSVEQSLRVSYPFKHTPTAQKAQEFLSAFTTHLAYSDAQKELLKTFLEQIGIEYSAAQIEDYEFETQLAKLGAIDILMSRWKQITRVAEVQNNLDTVRIPGPNTLPFFVIDTSDGTRASVVESGQPNEYHLAHPKNPEKIFTKESLPMDEILDNYPIAFRAVPRILLYSLITDGQITGGGALYNIPAADTFQEVFGAEYFPQVWMDVKADGHGLFNYQSMATFRRNQRVGYEAAERLVQSGQAAMVDLFISFPEGSREIVSQLLDKPDLETKDRVNLNA